jgi:hypothetical protein
MVFCARFVADLPKAQLPRAFPCRVGNLDHDCDN